MGQKHLPLNKRALETGTLHYSRSLLPLSFFSSKAKLGEAEN